MRYIELYDRVKGWVSDSLETSNKSEIDSKIEDFLTYTYRAWEVVEACRQNADIISEAEDTIIAEGGYPPMDVSIDYGIKILAAHCCRVVANSVYDDDSSDDDGSGYTIHAYTEYRSLRREVLTFVQYDPGTEFYWYCVAGGTIVNAVSNRPLQGDNLDKYEDQDVFTWNQEINSIAELKAAVEYGDGD